MTQVHKRHSGELQVPHVHSPFARLVQTQQGRLTFEDAKGQLFEGRSYAVPVPVGCSLAQAEERLYVGTLLGLGQKVRAAQVLGIPVRTFHKRCAALQIPADPQLLLARAKELGIHESTEALEIEAPRLLGQGFALDLDLAPPPRGQVWVAPGFDPLAMTRELIRQARSKGGVIQSEFLYSEPESALEWLAYEQQQSYHALFDSMPLGEVAREIARQNLAGHGLDVIALGPGGARREVSLVQHLLAEDPSLHHLRFYLLDLSQPLLWVAFRHAADTLASRRDVFPLAVQGNMLHLASYEELLYHAPDAPRRRLVMLLGGTFNNIQDEPSFISNVLGPSLSPGDLLLLDVICRPSCPEDDPRLGGRVAPDQNPRLYNWLSLPLIRHGGAESVEIRVQYTEGGLIPGSGAIVYTADTPDGRHFRLVRIGRYDIPRTVTCLEGLGWRCLTQLPFGEKEGYPRVLLLLTKVQP